MFVCDLLVWTGAAHSEPLPQLQHRQAMMMTYLMGRGWQTRWLQQPGACCTTAEEGCVCLCPTLTEQVLGS